MCESSSGSFSNGFRRSTLIVGLFLFVVICGSSGEVEVKFSSADYGYVNESSFFSFVIERIGKPLSSFTVLVELDPSHGDGNDFRTKSWVTRFEANSFDRELKFGHIGVRNDDLPEADESFRFNLRITKPSPLVKVVEPSTTVVTVAANDDASGIISIDTDATISVEESQGRNNSFTVPIVRRKGNFNNITVTFRISQKSNHQVSEGIDEDGSSDLYPISGNFTIEEGKDRGQLELLILDDQIPEHDEKFLLNLTQVDYGTLDEEHKSVELVIKANDSPLRFLHPSINVEEEDNHANALTVYVLRGLDEMGKEKIGPDEKEVFVSYRVIPGTATPTFDYNVAEEGTLRFGAGMHNATIDVFIVPDSEAEMAENFTIELLPHTIVGDAVVMPPNSCTITIQTNDEANGVLAIDFADSSPSESDKEKIIFIFDEDDPKSSPSIRVLRRGGSFELVSINWSLSSTNGNLSIISPISGTVTFADGQTDNVINFNMTSDETPREAEEFVFRLLPDTMEGGAKLDEENEVLVYIADSNDVYGIVNIQRGSKILFDPETDIREIQLSLERSGGTVGQVNVTYTGFFLPPDAIDTRDALPGVLMQPTGVVTIEDGEDFVKLNLEVAESAFIPTDSSFSIRLDDVVLGDRMPAIQPKTPRLGTRSSSIIQVTEEYASSEIGFTGEVDIEVNEPTSDEGPASIKLKITREGIWNEVTLDISYRSDLEPMEITRGSDYTPGPSQVKLMHGQKSATIQVTILPDDIPETDEVLIVRIDGVTPDDQKLRKNSLEKRILVKENDSPGGVFHFMNETDIFTSVTENESETIAYTIIRSEGDLVTRMVEYNIHPNGSEQFYGIPEILIFKPGDRVIDISLVPKDDDVPELAQNFTLELRSYGDPESRIGEYKSVIIQLQNSDDPHGVFVMADKEDGEEIPGRVQNIKESTNTTRRRCFYVVQRRKGTYGAVTVSWKVIPNDTKDVYPANGVLKFEDGVNEAIIDLWSVEDDVPESMEEFSLVLHSATGGARVGQPNNATFIIDSNDRAIFFDGPETVNVKEGREIVLHLRREGSGSDTTSVKYITRQRARNDTQSDKNQYGYTMVEASPIDDYSNFTISSDIGRVTFLPASLNELIRIKVFEDDTPEDDEEFFVEIFDAKGDYVVHGNTVVQVKIKSNDNASGVFSIAPPHSVSMAEGVPHQFSIIREDGDFRDVAVHWHIRNATDDGDAVRDFVHSQGTVDFAPGEQMKEFSVEAIKDNIPEYNEGFILELTNVSGGSAVLHSDLERLRANVTVVLNDYPYGRLAIAESSQNMDVSEDFEIDTNHGGVPPTQVDVTVLRTMGSDDNITAIWEAYDKSIAMPDCQDLIFGADLSSIDVKPLLSRSNIGTPCYQFAKDSRVRISAEKLLFPFNVSTGFALSVWIKPQLDKMIATFREVDISDDMELSVPIVTKYDKDENLEFHIEINMMGGSVEDMEMIDLFVTYKGFENKEYIAIVSLSDMMESFKNLSAWKHVILNFENDTLAVYVNSQNVGYRNATLTSMQTVSHSGFLSIGGKFDVDSTFIGLMQDLRVYAKPLALPEIQQIYTMPSRKDIVPGSGILRYGHGERTKTVTLSAVDDSETESNEEFRFKLLDVINNAAIGQNDSSIITVLKSDYANGLFGFSKACDPENIIEGNNATCFIKRTRGVVGMVTIHWKVQPLEIGGRFQDNIDVEDFIHDHGKVIFEAGQLQATFVIEARDDRLPEISENHEIILESAESHDGVISSTSTSDAAIDPEAEKTVVRIVKGDKPHGILQFSNGPPPTKPDFDQSLIRSEPLVVHVDEEQGVVKLLLMRAAGWHGDVSVEWRSRDGTAISTQSPRDYVSAAGTVHFRDGEGFKYINISILDDDEPELEKSFFVDMLTPTGGAELNEASHVEVIIDPSDHAFGIYQFASESLSAVLHEPDQGKNSTILKVKRTGGNLGETVLKWKVKDDADHDLDRTEGEISFLFGQTEANIEVSVLADDKPEFDEHFIIEMVEVSHGELGNSGSLVAMVTVPSNDDPYGVVSFKPETVIVEEGNENATLTVERTGGTAGSIRVHYRTVDMDSDDTSLQGLAEPDVDFVIRDTSFLMGENVTVATFTIPILDDEVPEINEDFFVQLVFVELMPSGTVTDSPRLGSPAYTMTRVVINENDNPNGILELSSSSVTVDEEWSDDDKPVVEIVRKYGTFGDVTVGVSATKGDAFPDEDFSVTSSKVTFLEGEDRKRFPVKIVNDFTPEFEEYFTVYLQPDSVTGGVRVGENTKCHVVIEKSDFPYGSLEISVAQTVVSEPADGNSGVPVELTVKRTGGLSGVVAVEWKAYITNKSSVDDHFELATRTEDVEDIDISSGVINLVSNQDEMKFVIKVMPDDVPEDDEYVNVKLVRILPTYSGVINRARDTAKVLIPANDFPYGTVTLEKASYEIEEDDVTPTDVRLKIVRRAGLFGTLRVVYSTEEIDLISEAIGRKENLVTEYFQDHTSVPSDVVSQKKHGVDLTQRPDPIQTCAEACMRQKACIGFVYSDITVECAWVQSTDIPHGNSEYELPIGKDLNERLLTAPAARFMYYLKVKQKSDILYDSQARSGMDYEPIIGASLLLQSGQDSGDIVVKTLSDETPELDEYFKVRILNVTVISVESTAQNQPTVVGYGEALVTIKENDFPYGIFTLRSSSAGSKDGGKTVEAEERPQLSLEMIVERKGGSVGDVTVDWHVRSGLAMRNVDFLGDDATLKFAHGETRKVISLSLIDDETPELNEDFHVELGAASGGAVVSSTEGSVHVIILANDNAGGIVSFHSRSTVLIGDEGDTMRLDLIRSDPAKGSCDVWWEVESSDSSNGVNATSGIAHFKSDERKASIWIQLIADDEPEIKEEYTVKLTNVRSNGIPPTGSAAIDAHRSQASITIRGSDEPHGVFRFAETSLMAGSTEAHGDLDLYVSRGFGAVGDVKVFFDVVPGHLSSLNPDVKSAEPYVDFSFNSDGMDAGKNYMLFESGVTSRAIKFKIIDDDIPELNEIFLVNLTSALLVERSPEAINFIPPTIDTQHGLSQVVIDANDGTKGMISFHLDSVNVTTNEVEGRDTEVTLTIIREKGIYGDVTFFIYPQNGKAERGKDYECEAKTMTILDNQDHIFYPITITDDDLPEGEESFEVILGNPSAGLQLGDERKATIYILSNDDAHGRLTFVNDPVIYIDEPTNDRVSNSKAELIIARQPEQGTFGDISVRYFIQREGQNTMDAVSEDVFPEEGFITFKNEVQQEVLEISALEDDIAELDESFLVTLSHPQGGATLSKNFTTRIIIRENDAPYGRFNIKPKNIREVQRSDEIEEGPGAKVMELDITRTQGSLGNVLVSVKSADGTALAASRSDGQPVLSAIQTFDAASMTSYLSFNHDDDAFLLALSSDRSGPMSTLVGSSGSLSSLTNGVHSTLYYYKGLFTPIQTIETDGASAALNFSTGGGRLYLFITNRGRYGRYETESRLYKVVDNGLRVVDEVTTKGASDATHFESAGLHYIVIANSIDNNQMTNINSNVYRFDVMNEKLVLVQTLPTRGAAALKTFVWNDNVYLVIANSKDSETDDGIVNSALYKWTFSPEGIPSFSERQGVAVSHANDVEVVNIAGDMFVAIPTKTFVSNRVTSRKIERVDIFKVVDGVRQNSISLKRIQSLAISEVNTIASKEVAASSMQNINLMKDDFDNLHLLTVASKSTSAIYWFNRDTNQFALLTSTGPSVLLYPTVVHNRTFVATAVDRSMMQDNRDDSSFVNTVVKSGVYFLTKYRLDGNSGMVDYLPIMDDLVLEFESGKDSHTIAITILDDTVPENEEIFTVMLDNSVDERADIDAEYGSVKVRIQSNDDAHGVIGFNQDSLVRMVEETEKDHSFTLNLVRNVASYGKVSVGWKANGNLADISPITGEVIFEDGQQSAGLQITILADDLPEVEEIVKISLSTVLNSGNKRNHLGAKINSSSAMAEIRILPNDSPHGIVRWSAQSLRSVIKEPETLSGASQLVTLEILRQQGQLGDIRVSYKTEVATNLPAKSQALPGADFIARDDSIYILENVTSATIAISIVPDDVPEDIESFYVRITDVALIGEPMMNSVPGIGPPGAETAEIIIDENDHARGFIQFNVTRNSKDAVEAFEMPGTNISLKLPLVRLVGAFRSVAVEWLAKPITASNRDFYPHSGTVHFEEGQRKSEIELFIVDDNDVEFVETFTVQLVGKPGGAKLGGDVTATIIILPNDSPSGMFGFLDTEKSIKESKTPNDPDGKVTLNVRRYQGSGEEVIVSWLLDESASNDLTPMSGKLHFSSGERTKSIVLRSLPDQMLEGAETYAVTLSSATGGAEISPIAGIAKVTIEPDDGAAGTVTVDSSSRHILASEPTVNYDGLSLIALHRGPGHFGECVVQWQITPADANAFYQTEGEAVFQDMENRTEIVIQTVDDDIPEMPQEFILRLFSASAGGEIDSEANSVNIVIAASDSPHGTFSFSQPSYYVKEGGAESTQGDTSADVTSQFSPAVVSLTLLRNYGHMGEVSVTVVTDDGSATQNEEYYGFSKRLLFRDGEFFKIIQIELLDDNIPEGPEDFFVNITDVSLMSYSSNDFIPHPPHNISIHSPPQVGDSSYATVTITKNDGAEGTIQFSSVAKRMEVDERDEQVAIKIERVNGNYGEVSITAKTMDKTAERNLDYLMPSSGVTVVFEDGQDEAYLTIKLVDDEIMEMAESFSVVLSGVNGGAKLGGPIVMEVVIKKSDYPNGVINFLEGDGEVTISNPVGDGTRLNFIMERKGGNMGEVRGTWRVVRSEPYYGDTQSTTAVSDDVMEPTSGDFRFADGEGGQRQILLTILSSPADQEVEEHFEIVLLNTHPAEVSETEGSVKITVERKGNPNGILQFTGDADQFASPSVIREPDSGSLQVVFPLERLEGNTGEISLRWTVEALNKEIGADSLADLMQAEGEVTFRDGQSNGEVIIYVKADDTPELAEKFEVKLISVEGGAELNEKSSRRQFMIQPNDDPHGVISIYSSDQSVVIRPDKSRAILLNVTRQRGNFGKVSVAFNVEFDNPRGNSLYLESDTGDVIIPDRSGWSVVTIPISSSAFLAVGNTFTARVTMVEYVGSDVTIPPKLSENTDATVTVPQEAGNPQVGFEPTVSQVYNTTRNSCRMTLKRVGLYGDVNVRWVSGYPDSRRSSGFREGQTMPTSSSIVMSSEDEEVNVSLTLFPNSAETQAFAAHVLKVDGENGEGTATILENHEFTEIEPCGVVRFSTSSQLVSVREQSTEVPLTIQRLYGSQYDIDVMYSTSPITAVPGKDYFPIQNGRIRILSGQQEATVNIRLIKDAIPETRKEFLVKISEVSEQMQLYKGLSPRILHEEATSRVIIQESDNAHGILQFAQPEIIVSEQSDDGSNIVVVMITVLRTEGSYGSVTAVVSTIGGGEDWQAGYMGDARSRKELEDTFRNNIRSYLREQHGKQATANEDYEVRQINVTFEERQTQVQVPIVILDDNQPEPSESFYAFLHSPTGGAKLGDADNTEGGAILKITILPNDFPNGNIGFSSTEGIVVYEDTSFRSVELVVTREAAFGNVNISWRAVPDLASIEDGSYVNERVDLDEQLEATGGEIECPTGVNECVIRIVLKDDNIAEFKSWFLVDIYQVSPGARIEGSRRYTNITVAESDHPHGLFQFSLQSRLPVVSKGNEQVGLTIERIGGKQSASSVRFTTRQLKSTSSVAGTTLYPAVADIDFINTNRRAEFKPGQVEAFVNIPLRVDTASPNPLPQIFQVKLLDVEGSGELNKVYDTANVTIVSNDNTKRVWRVYEAMQQNLDDAVVQSISSQLHSLANEPMGIEQVDIFHSILKNIVKEGRKRKLPPHIQDTVYDLFCKLLDPNRGDAVMGYTEFGDTFEQFAFSLITDTECKTDDSVMTSLGKCSHAMVQSARWYPEVINGYKLVGRESQDFFQLPVDLLDVKGTGVGSSNPTCYDISFIEYDSQSWYSVAGETGAMSNKIFSITIDGETMTNLITPVRYRVYTKDARISPKGAECVIWNEASNKWLSRSDMCTVEYDTDNYVDCACHHMSVYAVRGPTDNLAGYNEATYVSCFICAVAVTITILGYHVCSKDTTFASKLMMHMFFACGITQIFFVVSTLASDNANEEGCATIGIFLHYFWTSQFTWILVQAINIWKIMVMGNNSPEQTFTVYFLVGWGGPAVIVALHSIIMYSMGFTTISQIYGDVHNNGDLCFIMDAKAGLLSAVAPGCLAIMAASTIGLQLYQRDDTWKQYDDMFRGKFNQIEIPLLFWFFFLLSFSWVWGGLHLAYGQMWMLALFISFNMVQGLYLLVVYGILHNQLLRPVKNYEQDMPVGSTAMYAASAPGSRRPSSVVDFTNRSTQSLVGRSRDDADWGRVSERFSRSLPTRYRRESPTRDEAADLDDLVYALNRERMGPGTSREAIYASREPISTIYASPRRKPVRPSKRVLDDMVDEDRRSTSSLRVPDPSYSIADTHL